MSNVIDMSQWLNANRSKESNLEKNQFYQVLNEYNHKWLEKAIKCYDQDFTEYSAEFILYLYRTAHLAITGQEEIEKLKGEIEQLKKGSENNG